MRMLEQMIEFSKWIQQFTPQVVRQSVWAELSVELAWPVNTITTTPVVVQNHRGHYGMDFAGSAAQRK
ncbi:hypothetical protein PF001_g23474 [Phytophthora fragariae]|nr:hypothetical protein PF003_g40092 [Phytophthora fragariae]KAE9097135.1 hypothetical protein PF006_g23643 [Phytophthora fragariae]KAE9282112.1 hypothetical protein PF001_g23474 [Phytophthora fragariae]